MFFLRIELRWVLEKRGEIRRPSLLRDFGQVGRVVAALAKKRMTIDAIVFVPDILPPDDLGRQLVFIRERGKLPVAVDCQYDKYSGGYKRANNEKKPSLSFCHPGTFSKAGQ